MRWRDCISIDIVLLSFQYIRAHVDACIDSARNLSEETTHLPATSKYTTQHGLEVKVGGSFISQDRLVELKTCTSRKLKYHRWEHVYSQLFLSNTPNVFLAIHDHGHFHRVVKEKLDSPNLKHSSEKFQPQLWALVATLQAIQEMTITYGKKSRLSLVCEQGRLSVYERENKESCLPAEILARFEI